MTPEQVSLLIKFQLYLYDKRLINDYDWDWEKEAIKFLRKLKRESIIRKSNRLH